ncbi:LiaF transmembrane domain-containing protein [Leeia oryzae]|uniref:LiaF transmembrane domain-containing protein n=1 Tax=Leeia oryzae TaxID=356662 RepID=UPI00037D65CC|nr:hypothetical protein [Leeia oryzae]
MRRFLTPLLLVAMGVIWLLAELDMVDASTIFWPAVLGLVGISVWLDDGINRNSFPLGSGFLLAGALMAWRAMHDIRFGLLMPWWMIGMGVVLLVNRSGVIPPAANRGKAKRDVE